ncbi:MAG: hypothetical protein MJA83_07450 [Gammaproteobacteria bacterium]|nr:hypothetical protein [Gammaproteobacteria bacterium]
MNIVQTSESNLPILRNLALAYEAEFSSITGKKPGADGLFALDTVPDDIYDGFLLYAQDQPIGFAIVGHVDGRNDMAEFYVVPSMRRRGIGTYFACAIFNMYKGEWRIRQIEGADKAVRFWRKAIGTYIDEKYEEAIVSGKHWGKLMRQTFVKLSN